MTEDVKVDSGQHTSASKPTRKKKADPVVESTSSSDTFVYESSTRYINPAQTLAYDLFRIYQSYCQTQQQAVIEYWTKTLKNAYNPWK